MNKLYPFQEVAVNKLMNRRHTLLADEMGLGKTVQAISLINALSYQRLTPISTLVICKASIKENWKRKLEEWLDPHFVNHIQIINKKTDEIDIFSNIVIINYDIISHSYMFNQLTHIPWQLIICDEAHYLKNMDALYEL